MKIADAFRIFADHFKDHAIGDVEMEVDDEHDIVWWSCEILDLDGNRVGSAEFPEHWPEIHVVWG